MTEEFDWHQFDGEPTELPETPFTGSIISPAMMAKRLVWDAVPCDLADAVSKALGLPPASPDVEEMEHRQAHSRLREISPVMGVVGALTVPLSQAIVTSIILRSGGGGVISPAETQEAVEKFAPSLYMGLYAMLAELLDLDIIHLPHYGDGTMAVYVTGGAGE